MAPAAGLVEAGKLVKEGIIRGAFLASEGKVRWASVLVKPEPRILSRKIPTGRFFGVLP
jgi:hypothetical protein